LLEDYIVATVNSFSNQISQIIKNLSDTILAAVGVLLGSFIAALFKDQFNPIVFRFGIICYIFYIIFFPLTYNMLNQWQYYKKLCANFEFRLMRFRKKLYSKKIDYIVSNQVIDSKRRFMQWFRITLATYIIVILLSALAAVYVPQIMQNPSLNPPPTSPTSPISP
jgi:hypothetical protein